MYSNRIFSALALVTVILTAVVHGTLTDRWGTSQKLLDAAQKLSNIPMDFADWHGSDLPELPERTQRAAGATSYLRRDYVSSQGERISVTILCGRAGPLSSHAPDVCFAGSGYKQVTDSEVTKILPEGLKESEFYLAVFSPGESQSGLPVETIWGCSADGVRWDAVSDGRVKYAGKPFLYRIFLTTPEGPSRSEDAESSINRFLNQFLPVVAQALSSTEGNPSSSPAT